MTNAKPMKTWTFFSGVAAYCKDLFKLLKLDLYRSLKDKSIIVISIIVAAYALFYVFLGSLLTITYEVGGVVYHEYIFTARDAVTASTQLSSMPFLIIIILICIFVGKDLSYGTIRNKIIAGYSKKQIYVSTLIWAWLITLLLLVVFQLMAFALGTPLITFPSGDPYPGIADFWLRLGLGYLLVFLAVTIVVFIELVSRNMVTALVVSIILFVLGPMLSFFVASFITLRWGATSLAFEVFECFFLYDSFLISSGGSMVGIGYFTAVDSQVALKTLISSGASIVLLNWLGIYLFHKLDLK